MGRAHVLQSTAKAAGLIERDTVAEIIAAAEELLSAIEGLGEVTCSSCNETYRDPAEDVEEETTKVRQALLTHDRLELSKQRARDSRARIRLLARQIAEPIVAPLGALLNEGREDHMIPDRKFVGLIEAVTPLLDASQKAKVIGTVEALLANAGLRPEAAARMGDFSREWDERSRGNV